MKEILMEISSVALLSPACSQIKLEKYSSWNVFLYKLLYYNLYNVLYLQHTFQQQYIWLFVDKILNKLLVFLTPYINFSWHLFEMPSWLKNPVQYFHTHLSTWRPLNDVACYLSPVFCAVTAYLFIQLHFGHLLFLPC